MLDLSVLWRFLPLGLVGVAQLIFPDVLDSKAEADRLEELDKRVDVRLRLPHRGSIGALGAVGVRASLKIKLKLMEGKRILKKALTCG